MTATATKPRSSARNGSSPDPDWPKITDVPVGLVDVDDNVRSDVGDLEDLAGSIRQHGVMQPISVALSETEGRFTLVVGQRRLAAAKLAGLDRIPAIFDPRGSVGTPTRSIRQLVENVQRRDLNPLLEEADVATTTQVLLAVPWNLDRDVVQTAVSEAGYTMAKVWGFRRSPDCDCDAVQVDVQDGDGTKVAPACISADHAEAHNAAMRAASEQKAKEEAVDRDTVRKAFRASLDAANLHPTAARLILRELDSYGGPKWGEYEAMTDVAVLDRLAERLAVRWGTAYGSPVPLKRVLKAFEASEPKT